MMKTSRFPTNSHIPFVLFPLALLMPNRRACTRLSTTTAVTRPVVALLLERLPVPSAQQHPCLLLLLPPLAQVAQERVAKDGLRPKAETVRAKETGEASAHARGLPASEQQSVAIITTMTTTTIWTTGLLAQTPLLASEVGAQATAMVMMMMIVIMRPPLRPWRLSLLQSRDRQLSSPA
jgi:hypothetical protein